MKRYWITFHNRFIVSRKLTFVRWFHSKHPGKYCWADCVSYAFSSSSINPFKIQSAIGCKKESLEHSCKACYCGAWSQGKCFDLLSKEEQNLLRIRIKNKVSSQLPF